MPLEQPPESAESEQQAAAGRVPRERQQPRREQGERNAEQTIQDQQREIEKLRGELGQKQGAAKQTIYRATYEKVRRPLGKLLLGGAIVANPVLGLGAYAVKKTADKTISKVPVVGDMLYNKPMGIVGRIAEKSRDALASVVASPALAVDATKFVGRGIYKIADSTIFELYRDLKQAINHKFNFAEGTNLLASALIGVKAAIKALTIYPFKLVSGVVEAAIKRPIPALITGIAGYAFLSDPHTFVVAMGSFIDKVVSLLGNLASKIPSPVTP